MQVSPESHNGKQHVTILQNLFILKIFSISLVFVANLLSQPKLNLAQVNCIAL